MKDDEDRGKSGGRVTKATKVKPRLVKEPAPSMTSFEGQEFDSGLHESGGSKPPGASGARQPSAKSDLADQIGVRLRSVYDDVLAQPVPERFLELLRELETASYARAKKDGR